MVSNENLSIIEEINQELKNDKQLEFFKRNKSKILSVITAIVIGIIAYSSWYERKKKNMEDISNALLEMIQNPIDQNNMTLSKLLEEAPVELKPILAIMKSGKELSVGDFAEENLQPLLDLSQKRGVDLIWKDLALLIYASYPTKPSDELIKLLEPLVNNERPFKFSALEIMGMIYENEGKHEEAIKCFYKVLNSNDAPKSLKERVEMLLTYIKDKAGIRDSVSKPETPEDFEQQAVNKSVE